MSKINAVRLINLNYNNNAIRISDEIFHLNGESTLLSLRNGGGKSVLVQMMTAPFVHKRYRDTKDRPFESYFTTNKPTFILVEWVLDQGAGYVLTGMMVRRSQEISEESGESLEMINFITEYRERCQQDIYHLPVVEKTKKEIVLKNFGACRQLFETYKRDKSMHFSYYDMNNNAQSRQYFDRLKEYKIDYKEWETIIKKVNLKESGLSELFADCRDEKGLVEKWFLEAVESKLNKDKNRMKEFQNILEKYVGQYKDNKSKIQRRDTIRRFQEEAVGIEERALEYRTGSQKEMEWENKIANFLAVLEELSKDASEKQEGVEQEQKTLREDILHIEYEQLSQEIYELVDKERYHTGNRDMIEMEREALEQEIVRIENQLHLFDCARQQEEADEEKKEYARLTQLLEVSRQKEENLEPERKQIGETLYCYYKRLLEESIQLLEEKKAAVQEVLQRTEKEKENRETIQNQLVEISSGQGKLKARMEVYDEKENSFNEKYETNLERNILGEYESGELELRQKELVKQLELVKREKTADCRLQNQLEEAGKGLSRSLSDSREEALRRENEIKETTQKLDSLEEELTERRLIMKYLELSEKQLFDTEAIVNAVQRKLQELERIRRQMEKEEDELQKEYLQLTQGKVLELPEEFSALLQELGLHYVYGMEYLNKNGNSVEENQRLVKEHPFLPYALILSGQELAKLSAHTGEIYTSFPIPIILRESLEKESNDLDRRVIDFEQVSFYVLFNENLLDEEKLALMVREKEEQIRQKREAIAVRQQEYQEYFSRKETIGSQKVTKELYEGTKEQKQEQEIQLEHLKEEIQKNTEKLAETEEQLRNLEQKIAREEKEQIRQENRLETFEALQRAYESYLEDRRQWQRLKKEAERLEEQKRLTAELLEKLEENRKTLESQQGDVQKESDALRQTVIKYAEYEPEQGMPEQALAQEKSKEPEAEEVVALEARYEAITSKMSMEIQLLETQLQSAGKRLEKAQNRLKELCEKYGLAEGAWLQVVYNSKEEEHQEELLKDRLQHQKRKELQWNEENKEIAVLTQQIKERKGNLQAKFQKEEPLPRADIRKIDFQTRIRELNYQCQEKQKELAEWEKKVRNYEEHLTAMAEYSQFPIAEVVTWEKDFQEMGQKELREFKGLLVRDYKESIENRRRKKERLVNLLNQIVRKEEFQEDFYRKPLESMLELTEEAEQVLSQLATTVQSYERLMEKLEVDISLIEKEKTKIVELLEDYISDVHQNLGRIDHNSTITIREKPVKMLKIQLPDWESNVSLYQVRLNDFIDDITEKGIEIFEKNENAQEYFGARMTTRNLYHQIVGIGNIQIRLYKVEEQREYPITWAEVAKNSGGEGFLSAFIILTSLLYYMRRDESDIFADRNEGKVLLMDNPFAQTNAAHLLKPLMDMAKKTNTQLICLSGLGGDSIYNRFDNIYVLNLIAASLRGGMQYLKADHTRGNEPETMIVSQIEVFEQQELIF